MFLALNWFVVVSLLLIWSFAAWTFHSIAAWTVANATTLAGSTGAIEALQVPGWLTPWVPSDYASSLTSMIASFTPAIQSVLEWIPAVAGGLSIAVWTVWGIGTALLIVLGLLGTALITFLRGRVLTSATSSRRQEVIR